MSTSAYTVQKKKKREKQKQQGAGRKPGLDCVVVVKIALP